MMEMLNQMDGFNELDQVKVIMATNRPDTLDPALLRPGRLDRKVEIPLPNAIARKEILRIHSEKMQKRGEIGGGGRDVRRRLRLAEQADGRVQRRGPAERVHGGGDVRDSRGAELRGERGLHEGCTEADGGEEAGEQDGVPESVLCLLGNREKVGRGEKCVFVVADSIVCGIGYFIGIIVGIIDYLVIIIHHLVTIIHIDFIHYRTGHTPFNTLVRHRHHHVVHLALLALLRYFHHFHASLGHLHLHEPTDGRHSLLDAVVHVHNQQRVRELQDAQKLHVISLLVTHVEHEAKIERPRIRMLETPRVHVRGDRRPLRDQSPLLPR